MKIVKPLLAILFFQFCVFESNSQVEKYVYDTKGADGLLDISKVFSLIPRDSNRNIFLISDPDHRFKSLRYGIEKLLGTLLNKLPIDRVFYENTWEHDALLKLYHSKGIDIKEYTQTMMSKYYSVKLGTHDSINLPYYDNLKDDLEDLKSDNYTYLIQEIQKTGQLDKLVGIDIGTQTGWLGLYHLSKITKQKNLNNSETINTFLDSIRVHYGLEFWRLPLWFNDTASYKPNVTRINNFLEAIQENTGDSVLTRAWKNVFATYFEAYKFKDLSVPKIYGGRDLSHKEYFFRNSFRDSIIYENFNFFLPHNWNNLAIFFSTVHLTDSKNQFTDIFDSTIHTLGRYLNSSPLKPNLRKIALLCYNTNSLNKLYDNRNFQKSLEYKLSKKYEFAYIDLSSYRKDISINKPPFYMRPIFFTYRNLNWENLYDGIIFIRDCGCNLN